MPLWLLTVSALWCSLLISPAAKAAGLPLPSSASGSSERVFAAKGVVEELKPDGQTVIIRHEAISNFMAAMTMPFKVKETNGLAGLSDGDEASFQLHVTETESWVDQFAKTGSVPLPEKKAESAKAPPVSPKNPLLYYKFTNELDHAVSLDDFRGQALAITFIYTRCPLPEYCPRLSKNFQEASHKLATMTNAPTNWHFLSVSFDPEFDTPETLKRYGEYYDYDPAHWSFLTGPADKIKELVRSSGVTYEFEGATINHDFRTLIVDASGHLQMVFPTSGDLSDAIVSEIIKAAAVTNSPISQSQ